MALSCRNSSTVSAFLPLRLYLCASSMEGVAALTSSKAWEGGALLATIGWKGSSTSVSASLMALDLMAGWFFRVIVGPARLCSTFLNFFNFKKCAIIHSILFYKFSYLFPYYSNCISEIVMTAVYIAKVGTI